MIRAVATLAICVSGAGALAQQDRFFPPVGCAEQLTVQSRGCEVSNIWTCAADMPGESWRVDIRQSGPIFLSKIDSEGQWLESYDLFPTRKEVLIEPAKDPASLSELLEKGADSYDFIQRGPDGETRAVGYDRLTGVEVTIDNEPLLETEFSIRFEDETGPFAWVAGNEYVSAKHRRFLSGTRIVTRDGESYEEDSSPVDFIYPGEPGFFANTPLYDCETSLARFDPTVKGSDQ